ncbi:hypothetical protein TNCV_4056941 [Trichonephila clavipes]|nr:hypothetical protein TNCV_4056941 [Trichonephila clavipes]
MVQKSRENVQKQQHMNGTENILLKGCTAKGVQNYDQKSSGRPENGAAWNSFNSGSSSKRLSLWTVPSAQSFGR